MRFVVGSPNPVKTGAVDDAFSKYFDVEVFSVDVGSGVKDVFTKQGVIGVLTRGEIDRRSLLADAVVCALTPFLNPEYYRDT